MQLFYKEPVILNKDVSKYLNVIINSKLNFNAFINHIESKIVKSVGILRRLRYLFPSSTLLLLYSSLIQPHLLYGRLLWELLFPPISQICSASKTKLYKLYLIPTTEPLLLPFITNFDY